MYKKRFQLLIITCLTAAFLISFSACGPKPEQEIEPAAETIQEEEITTKPAEETIEVLEEEVDYTAVSVSAEMEGFIPGYLCTEKDNYITISITNTSDFKWKKDGENMVRIGYHYHYKEQGTESYDNPTRTSLPQDVMPGETVDVDVLINNIDSPGNYILRIDLVLEGNFWFSSKGVEMIEGETYIGSCNN